MKRKNAAAVLKDEGLALLNAWLAHQVEAAAASRKGTPRGKDVGIFPRAEGIARKHVLFSNPPMKETLMSLAEVAYRSGDSLTMAKQRRRQRSFMARVEELAKDFSHFVEEKLFPQKGYHEERIYIELLALLPGFNIVDNLPLDKWRKLLDADMAQAKYFEKLFNIMRLYFNLLTSYLNNIPEDKQTPIEEAVYPIVSPLIEKVDLLVEEGKERDIIEEALIVKITDISMRIQFLSAKHRVVI